MLAHRGVLNSRQVYELGPIAKDLRIFQDRGIIVTSSLHGVESTFDILSHISSHTQLLHMASCSHLMRKDESITVLNVGLTIT